MNGSPKPEGGAILRGLLRLVPARSAFPHPDTELERERRLLRAGPTFRDNGKSNPLSDMASDKDLRSPSDADLDGEKPMFWYRVCIALLRHLLTDPAPAKPETSSDGFCRWLGLHQGKIDREKAIQEARRGGGPVNHLPQFRFADPLDLLKRPPKGKPAGRLIPKFWYRDQSLR